MTATRALVLHVLSGDALRIELAPKGQEKPRQTIARLACVNAPRLLVSGDVTAAASESCGWEARERLRALTIGKVVEVTIWAELHEIPRISLSIEGVDVSMLLVSEGLASVHTNAMCCPENIEELVEACATAKSKQLGMWSEKPVPARTNRSIIGDNARVPEFVEANKGKSVPAVVEEVRDGGTLRLSFVDSGVYAQLSLTGITVDKWHREAGEATIVADEFAEEAKKFTETRLLGRLLNFRIDGNDNYGNIFGTALHPKGNVSELLLLEGYAKLNDFSFNMLPDPAGLRAALQKAKQKRIGKWKDIEIEVYEEKREFFARVIEVHSGDVMTILEVQKGVTPNPYDLIKDEKRVYLSSIRCPRGGSRNREPEPWSYQALECVTELCAGKRCRIVLDYIRNPMPSNGQGELPPASDDLGRLHFVTVFTGGQNSVNLELVKRGFAKTQRHRADEERSGIYDKLVEAEKSAQEAKLGIWGTAAPPKRRLNDLTGTTNSRKARDLEGSFKRLGKLAGVIEAVISGSRYRVVIPKESAVMTVILSGIRTPQTARLINGVLVAGQPLADEAVAWARLNLLHKKVTFTVSGCDRGGAFIAEMWLMSAKTSVQEELCRAGLAYTDDQGSRWCSLTDKLVAEEAAARKAIVGVWALPEMLEAKQAQEDQQAQDGGATPSTLADERTTTPSLMPSCIVSHVDDTDSFYVQPDIELVDSIQEMCNQIGDEADGLPEEQNWQTRYSVKRKPRKGDLLLARYANDDQWYRAVVENVLEATPHAEVFYVDYGDRAKTSFSALISCPPHLNLINHPPLALRVCLGCVHTIADIHVAAGDELNDLTVAGSFSVEVLGDGKKNANGAIPVILKDADGKCLNRLLLAKGLVKLLRGTDPALPFYEEWKAAEKSARKHRRGMWFYGDVGESDDDGVDAD